MSSPANASSAPIAPIAVAVGFDHHTLGLIEAAAVLCRKVDRPLCLLHVIEPWMDRSHSQPLGGNDVLWNVTQSVETSARAQALARLDELVSDLPPYLIIRKVVVSGRTSEALCREAQLMGAGLLLIGAGGQGKPHWSAGLSTALAVVSSATVPVAVIDTTTSRFLRRMPPRLLLADDLGPASATAADFALELAAALGEGELHHIHVNGVSTEALQATLTTAIAASHTPSDPARAPEIYRQFVSMLRGRLEARAGRYLHDLQAAECRYLPEILTGKVSEQLGAAVTRLDPDVLVFGRHKAFHNEPFFIGRVPFKAMLGLGRPVIIVPND